MGLHWKWGSDQVFDLLAAHFTLCMADQWCNTFSKKVIKTKNPHLHLTCPQKGVGMKHVSTMANWSYLPTEFFQSGQNWHVGNWQRNKIGLTSLFHWLTPSFWFSLCPWKECHFSVSIQSQYGGKEWEKRQCSKQSEDWYASLAVAILQGLILESHPFTNWDKLHDAIIPLWYQLLRSKKATKKMVGS